MNPSPDNSAAIPHVDGSMTVTVCHDVYLTRRNLLPRLYTFSMVYRQEILTSIPPPKTNGKSILTWNDKSLSNCPAFSLFQWNNRDDTEVHLSVLIDAVSPSSPELPAEMKVFHTILLQEPSQHLHIELR